MQSVSQSITYDSKQFVDEYQKLFHIEGDAPVLPYSSIQTNCQH